MQWFLSWVPACSQKALAFRTHQMHGLTAGHGHNLQHEYQNPHSSNPVGKASPDQNAVGKILHPGQNTAPVVVKPDIISNRESVKLGISPVK